MRIENATDSLNTETALHAVQRVTKFPPRVAGRSLPSKRNLRYRVASVGILVGSILLAPAFAPAQAAPAADRKVAASVFGGLSLTKVGVLSGKNLSLTAGLDLRLRTVYSLSPYFEVRGTFPVDKGQVAGAKNVLAGFRIAKTYGRFTPYGNFLFGLGKLNYDTPLANPDGTFAYFSSSSNVLSPGGGVDIMIRPALDLKVDGQVQRYSTPIADARHIYAKSVTVGLVYHLFPGRAHR